MKRFDSMPSENYLGKKNKPKELENLHDMGISIEVTPFQNIIEGVEYLLHDFPRAKNLLQ